MPNATRGLGVALVVLAGFFAWVMVALADNQPPRTDAVITRRVAVPKIVGAELAAVTTSDVGAFLDGVARAEYIAAVEKAEAEAAAAQEQARLEAERQAAIVSRPAPVQAARPSSTVGECTGFAVPDYIIQRESGGNPSAYNPSGAYGCAQTLLSHYSGGSCRGLDPYTIDGQRQCVWILSNGGTNLAPWAG